MKKKTQGKFSNMRASDSSPSFYDSEEFLMMEREYEKYVLRIKNLSRGV